jgi:16S rRNA (guanine1516-N2)-methyltransferase
MRLALTHSNTVAPALYRRARSLATAWGLPYLPRNHMSLNRLIRDHDLNALVIVTKDDVVLHYDGANFGYHPNAAKLRFFSLRQGLPDRMAQAMDLRTGDQVLDCTCGLGADATVAAHLVGPQGKVLALEKSVMLTRLVHQGLQTYIDELEELVQAMRRVKVQHADAAQTLAGLDDDSWDVVYFDPFFEHTVQASQGLDLVRLLGADSPLQEATVAQARRVARRRVVCKDRPPGTLLKKLGFERMAGAKRVCFGYLEAH